MGEPLLLAFVSVGSFLGLAYAAVSSPRTPFQRMTTAMAVVAAGVLLLSPGAGAALLGPVVLSRRLANAAVPDTVAELLGAA